MEIAVIGDARQLEEVKLKFGDPHHYFLHTHSGPVRAEVIFHFGKELGDLPSQWQGALFVNAALVSLSERFKAPPDGPLRVYGFCGLPTFLNRPVLEVTLLNERDQVHLKDICTRLHTDYQVVADHVGLVTPRVICMIINEAFFTLQEGIASREDIDLAMKLGTNYPWGPFEWCDRIGAGEVVALLNAVYRRTGNERYRVCPLLEAEQAKN